MARWIARLASLGFLAVLFYYPLAAIFARGLTNQTFGFLFQSQIAGVVWFTIWQALASTLGSLIIGVVFAYLLYRKNFRGQQFLRGLFTVPFVLPILVIAMAFNTFQFSNAIVAIVLSHIYINAPLVARAVGSAWLQLDGEVDDAAELDGAGRLRTFFSVTVFQLRQILVSSFVLVFAYCSAAFGTVLLMGDGLVNSIETAIYQQVFSYLNLPAAIALGAVQLALTLALFFIGNRLVHGNFSFGVSVGASVRKLDRRDLPIAFSGLLLGVLWAAPIWNTFQITLGINAEIGMNDEFFRAASNSARNIAIVILLSAAVGLFVSYQLAHESTRFRKLLGYAYLTPISVSTVLVGLGYLIGFSGFRSSWLVIPLAQTVLALPLVVRIVSSALLSIDRELLEQAKVDGAKRWQIFRQVELPLVSDSFRSSLGFAGIIALGDFGASAFLSYGDQDTLPILLYRYFSRPGAENYQQAMSLTALLIAAAVAVVLVTSVRLEKRNAPLRF